MSTKKTTITAAALAAAGALVVGGAAMANAATTPTPTPSAGQGYSQQVQPGQPGYGQQGAPGYGQQGGDQRGRGMHQHTDATAEQTTQVKAAVTAKDSTITVADVMVDPDGSYDARGTKAGQPVMVEVSKDLKTVEVRTGGPGRHGHGHGGDQGQPGQAPTGVPTGAPSSSGTGA